MKRTEIIDHKIVNWVEQLASLLKHGDIFRKPRGSTQYQFEALKSDEKMVVCRNMVTHAYEQIYFNSPVYRLMEL